MKYRMGFVTNSSSSSFNMNFKSKHSVLEELVNKAGIEKGLAEEVAEIVTNSGEKLSKKELKKLLQEEIKNVVRFENLRRDRDYTFGPLSKEDEAKVSKQVSAIMEKIEDGTYTVAIEVGDHSELGSMLEHDILPYAQPTVIAFFSRH